MKISKELKAGLIALISIVGFVLLFQFMKGKNLFTTDNVFYAKYGDVEGLEPSSPVSINGLKVGQIEKITPLTGKDGKLHFLVEFIVDDKFPFSKNSTVEIFAPDLMSGKQLKINLVYQGALAKDGDTLIGNLKPGLLDGLADQVGPVKDQLQSVMKSIDSLANSANKVLDDRNRAEIKALLAGLNQTVGALGGASQNVNALLANNDPRLQKVLDNASQTMTTANSTVGKYGKIAEDFNTQQLNATVKNLDATVGKLNTLISGINSGEGTLGKAMKDEQLYNNLAETSKNLNELIVDMKQNPKRYVNISVFGKNNKEQK